MPKEYPTTHSDNEGLESVSLHGPATLELIQHTAQKAQKPELIAVVDDIGREYRALVVDGQVHPVTLARPPRPDYDHRVRTLEDLQRLVSRQGDQKGQSLWVSDNAVVHVMDADLRDRAVLRMPYAATFVKLYDLNTIPRTAYNHEGFVELLRVDLGPCQEKCPELLVNARHLNFHAKSTSTSEIEHGRSSLGKSHEMELTGADKIPEQVELCTDVYEEFGVKTCILCTVSINLRTETISLTPQPCEIARAQQLARMFVFEGLLELMPEMAGRIYYGTP